MNTARPPSQQADDGASLHSPAPSEQETVECPLCGSDASSQVRIVRDLKSGTREPFVMVRCDACGHVYLNPRPTADQILRYYPDDYAPHHNPPTVDAGDSDPAVETAPWYLSHGVRRIPGLRRAYYWLTDSRDVCFPTWPRSGKSPPRVLELGCSDGDYLLSLKEQGWETIGIEPAAAPARRAQQRGLDVHCGVLQSGLFIESSFDAVCAWHVFEHLHEPRVVVEELSRIIKPGGELLLSVPNYGCWEPHVFGDYWLANEPPIHLQQFTPRTMRKLLESGGFDVVACEHQRNLSNVVGSVGLYLGEKRWFPRLAERLLSFPDAPTTSGQLFLAIPAKILAACRQGGRLTIRACRRP